MKYTGEKSLSSLILFWLRISWYFSLVLVVCIIIGLLIIGIFNPGFIPDQKVGKYELEESLLYITFPAKVVNISIKSHLLFSLGLWVLPNLIGFTLIQFYLKKIFSNFTNNIIFTKENVINIKIVGWVTIIWGFLKSICFMLLGSYIVHNISVFDVDIQARGFIFPASFFITSILLFVLSKTFECIVNRGIINSKGEPPRTFENIS